MPPQTPIFTDVALQQLRRGRTVALFPPHDMAAATLENAGSSSLPVTSAAAAQRLPSTRPLDQRWDHSRGIVFGNVSRTWSPGNAIVFGQTQMQMQTPATHRSYASKAVAGTQAILNKPVGDSSMPMLDDAHRASGFGGLSTRSMQDLRKEIKTVSDTIKAKDVEIRRLQDSSESKDDLITKLRQDIQEAGKKLSTAQEAYRKDRMQLQTRLNLEQEARIRESKIARALVDKTIDDQRMRYEQEISRLKEEHGASLQTRIDRYETDIERIRQLSASGLASNEPVLERARVEGENRARAVLEPQHAAALKLAEEHGSGVRKLQRELDTTKRLMQNEKWQAQSKLDVVNNEAKQQRDRANRLSARNDELQKEVDGRTRRAENDRPDYHGYQEIFKDLDDAVNPVRVKLRGIRATLRKESEAWRESLYRFQKDGELTLFRQMGQYDGARKAITAFLESRTHEARKTADAVGLAYDDLSTEYTAFGAAGHDSRTLTRYLHFGDVQTEPDSTKLAHLLANVAPFRERREEMTHMINELQNEIIHAHSTKKGDLQQQLTSLKSHRELVIQLICYHERVRETAFWRSVMLSSPAEKLILRHAKEVQDRLILTSQRLNELTVSGEDRRRQLALRSRERLLKYELQGLLTLKRRKIMYTQGFSEDDREEVAQYDGEVINRLVECETEEKKWLDALVEGRRPSLRLERYRMSAHLARAQSIRAALKVKPRAKENVKPLLVAKMQTTMEKKKSPRNTKSYQMHLEELMRTREIRQKKGKSTDAINLSIAAVEVTIAAGAAIERKSQAAGEGVTKTTEEAGDSLAPSVTRTGMRKRPVRSARRKGLQPNTSSSSASTGGSNIEALRASLAEATRDKFGRGINLTPTAAKKAAHDRLSFESDNHTLHISRSTGDIGPLDSPSQSTEMSQSPRSCATAQEETPPVEEEETPELAREPQTMLTYQIPPKDYREAAMASQSSNAAFWSHSLYKSPAGNLVKVFYCRSLEAAERQLKLFLDEPVLGFDMEWEQYASLEKGPVKQNASLVQIAAEDKICLVHMACFTGDKTDELMPPTLRKILESSEYIKAGVNVVGDANRLRHCFGVNMHGLIELSHLYRLVKYSQEEPSKVSFRLVSLAEQVQNVLLLPLLKSDVRVSAWSRTLNQQQSVYAAADAYAGYRLYHKLDNERKLMDPPPPRPPFFETGKPIVLGNGDVVERSKRRPRMGFKKPTAGEASSADDEEDVFFDALEKLPETYELAALAPGANPAAVEEASKVVQTCAPLDVPTSTSKEEQITAQSPTLISTSKSATAPKASKTQNLSGPETQLADDWAHANPPSGKKIGLTTLRAYHLWHHQSFSLQEVAALCREPPLALTTVASYVLQAIKEEGLDYQEDRARVALECLPKGVWPAYAKIVKAVEKDA